MHVSDIGLMFRVYEDISKLSNKKTNNTLFKIVKNLNRHFTREAI